MRSVKTTIQNLNAVVRIVCTTNYNAELLQVMWFDSGVQVDGRW